ncbi:MAG TPA: hypothetical protein VFV02_09640 [Acidimicrobiales bacterium]|nr:hypothetical protein [Acidimicrobiales bacterium]
MIAVTPDGGVWCSPILPFSGCSILPLGGDVAGSAASAAAGGLINAMTSFLSAADSWLVGHIAGLYDVAPDLHGSWFRTAYQSMVRVFEAAVTPVLLVATIGSVVRQDLRRLGRIWGLGLPLATLAAAGVALFTDLAMRASDGLTGLVVGAHLDIRGPLLNLATNPIAAGSPALVSMGVYSLALVGGVLVWLELVLRSAAIYVAVFFMPLGLVTYVWPATAGIAKRSVEVLVALVLCKFVIFSTLWLGLSAVSGGNSIDGTLEGSGILLLASFSPFVLLKLVPIAEVNAIAHLEGMSRRPFRAASRGAATVAGPGHPVVQRVLATRGSSETTTPQASQVMPQPLPTRKPDYVVSLDGESNG